MSVTFEAHGKGKFGGWTSHQAYAFVKYIERTDRIVFIKSWQQRSTKTNEWMNPHFSDAQINRFKGIIL